MNPLLHKGLRFVYATFLLASGTKHLVTVVWGDPSVMATGYEELEAQAFVSAVLETGFLLPFICLTKVVGGALLLLPGREPLGVLVALPYATGMLLWGVFMVPSHLAIMGGIFLLNAALVVANWTHYQPLWKSPTGS